MNEYLTLLRGNRNFRNLWFGSVISQFGDWFNVIASAELITRLTDSGIALSALFLARFLPLFLFSPVAGVLADRFDRRRIMVLSDVLRGVTVLGFLLVREPGHVWLFYGLTVVQFSLSALFTPARGAALANVVPARDLVAANALDSLTWSTMLALGAFLGGVVAALFGAEAAFVADAASFGLSAVFIARVVLPKVTADPRPSTAAEDMRHEIRDTSAERSELVSRISYLVSRFAFLDGFRYLWREPFILGIALAKAGGSLVWGAINVLEITYANELFPLSGADRFGVADPGTATLGLIYVVSGLGTGTLWVFSSALLQTIVPDRFRGRVFSFEFAALTLTQSISTLAGGFLLDTAGLPMQSVMAVMAGVALLTSAAWVAFHRRHRAVLRGGGLPLRTAAGPSAVPQLPERGE